MKKLQIFTFLCSCALFIISAQSIKAADSSGKPLTPTERSNLSPKDREALNDINREGQDTTNEHRDEQAEASQFGNLLDSSDLTPKQRDEIETQMQAGFDRADSLFDQKPGQSINQELNELPKAK